MTQEKLISIHSFYQEYDTNVTSGTQPQAVVTVYLTIHHVLRRYSITPLMPSVGEDLTPRRTDMWHSIADIAFPIKDIGHDFARTFATQAAIFKAMLYACEELSLARPTQVRDIRRMFD